MGAREKLWRGVALCCGICLALLLFYRVQAGGKLVPVENADDPIYVKVTGQVQQPQVLELPRGSTLSQAVEQCGGVTELGVMPQDRALENGEIITIPSAQEKETSDKININTANIETLDKIPGVGEATAQAILEYRQANGGFRTLEELLLVPGIGEKKLESMRPYITLEEDGGSQKGAT